ncbi:hypothetical protein AOQ84DRAFT_119811 [Glonium stellatum]|uniref:Uncharacterized protein n=1 Tax=Glonium stellatum TaxID=574774 RepID=A0A8E2F9T0_9PEZI|nr:hypothetical protein AOQ84DRAFT_119811 [Glonium stellatum]
MHPAASSCCIAFLPGAPLTLDSCCDTDSRRGSMLAVRQLSSRQCPPKHSPPLTKVAACRARPQPTIHNPPSTALHCLPLCPFRRPRSLALPGGPDDHPTAVARISATVHPAARRSTSWPTRLGKTNRANRRQWCTVMQHQLCAAARRPLLSSAGPARVWREGRGKNIARTRLGADSQRKGLASVVPSTPARPLVGHSIQPFSLAPDPTPASAHSRHRSVDGTRSVRAETARPG